jgi:hypothetical protein
MDGNFWMNLFISPKKRNSIFIMTSSIDPADIEMAKNTMSLKIILRNL